MDIILQEDVEKLGTRGEVVTVKEGYARNYLLPRNLALEASPSNLKRLEKIRGTLAKRTATERDQAEAQAAQLAAELRWTSRVRPVRPISCLVR